jgi:ATP-binding cassette subfamily G (WHITE) protein 2 (SNQ2)
MQMIIATIISTVWVNQPKTSAAAFTRGGVLFISLLFNAFQAFGELVGTMVGRPIVNKHRSYAFYRPSALWIAQIGVDLCYQSIQIFCFGVMVYFSTGLIRDPGAFFTYILFIISAYLCQALFFRTVGCLSPDFDVAIRIASTGMTALILTTGYLIQWENAHVWFRWIFYINALGLGFSSLMVNEFKRINLTCTDTSLIPNGPGYGDIKHQVCTLLGSEPGNPIVSGAKYLETSFSYHQKDLWRNFGLILVIIAFFLTANLLLGELVKYGAGGRTITFFVKEDQERRGLNRMLRERREKRTKNFIGDGLQIDSKSILTWENVNYDVPVPSGTLRILNGVYGYVKPGELTALMGASGAGKTTLLDVLAARKNIGVISGDILIDGLVPGKAFQRGTSYAEQLDVHEPAQTVREALRFSADLRQPYETPQAEKYAYVEDVIALLELEEVADAIIGSPESGLSPPQRKLVTIGVELAARPQLLLFLDEPTSGLDSQSAWNIARFLKKLAGAGQAVLCTIHQPNSALFQQFDRLLLLQKGGRCVYFGDIGEDASNLIGYFRRNGAECPPDANPAEWMLDAIGAGLAPRLGDRDWGDRWVESPEFVRVKSEIIELKDSLRSTPSQQNQIEYATPIWHQIKKVVKRQSVSYWRSPNYGFTRFFNHIITGLLPGLCFLQLNNSRSSLQDRVFVIFQVTVLPALILAQVEPKYALAREISYREQAAKAYKEIPFALSMVIAEIPYSLICAVAFYLLIYFIPGFQLTPSRAGYQFLMVLILEYFAVILGQFIAAITPSPKIAALFNPPMQITFALFCGVTIPAPQMPKFWRSWLYQLVPFTRLVGGMMVTELHDREVVCTPKELQHFTAPPGQTCGDYMQQFFANRGPGYLVNNATDACAYCAYKVGDQFYEPLGYSFDHRWRDLGILSAYIGSTLILLLLAVSLRYELTILLLTSPGEIHKLQ